MTQNKPIIATMTGEVFQPVRIFYKMYDKAQVTKVFRSLSCMKFDKFEDRWVWEFWGETKNFKFDKPYKSIPKHLRPIVLGSIFSREDDEMHLDVGSIERAVKAIKFFDKRINRTIAEVTNIGISNKILSDKADHPGSNFDEIFKDVEFVDPVEKMDKMKAEHGDDFLLKMMEESQDFLQKKTKPKFEKAEILPANFYDDGIELLQNTLKMRQMVAFEHFRRNTDYSLADVINQMTGVGSLPER